MIFAPIVRGIEIGLLRNASERELLSFATAVDTDGRVAQGEEALVISLFDRDRVRQVHKFCKIWEDELGISAGPSKRPVRKKRSVKKFKSTRGTCSNGNRKQHRVKCPRRRAGVLRGRQSGDRASIGHRPGR